MDVLRIGGELHYRGGLGVVNGDGESLSPLLPVLPFDAQVIGGGADWTDLSATAGIDLLFALAQVQIDFLRVRDLPMDIGALTFVDVRAVSPELDGSGSFLDVDCDLAPFILIVPASDAQDISCGVPRADLRAAVSGDPAFLVTIAEVDGFRIVDIPT